MALLEFNGVSKRFHRGQEVVVALDAIDLTVSDGSFVALVGPSGSGKSTLLHLAGGLDSPDDGKVIFQGADLGSLSVGERARLRRKQVGFVFQFFHLIPTLTVLENVELPLLLDGARRDGAARDALGQLGLGHRLDHLPGELSGGEMQRAAIARALVARPALLLADEPTGNLDSATGAEILDVLQATVGPETAVLMVTHDAGAASRADRVLHLRDGRLVDDVPAAPPEATRKTTAPKKAGAKKAVAKKAAPRAGKG